MPSVPTAAITSRNPRQTSVVGQARPCRTATLSPNNTPLLQVNLSQKPKSSVESSVESSALVIKGKRVALDFYIGTVPHSPRLG
jgi:hypothetical protein